MRLPLRTGCASCRTVAISASNASAGLKHAYWNGSSTTSRGAAVAVLLLLLLPTGALGARKPPAPGYRDVPLEELLALGVVPSVTASGSSTTDGSSGSGGAGSEQPLTEAFGLHNEDFVYVTGSCRDRLLLAKSSRAWRRGIRGFILTDVNDTETLQRMNVEGAAHGDSFAFFPDDGDALLGTVRHGKMSGDTRAALAPFAAHRHYGDTFKWMVYGDDDTLFYTDALKHMLSAHDPEQPLAFSDNLWYGGRHPNPHAPRCLPCSMADEELPSLEQILSAPHMRDALRKSLGAATTDEELAAVARNATQIPGRSFVPRPACPYCTPKDACPLEADPRNPCKPSGAHGGAGIVFSVGLFRHIAFAEALKCMRGLRDAPGGDYMVSYCLWQHGVAFTDPGPLVRNLYSPFHHVFGANAGMGFLFDPVGMLTHGRCDNTCKWMIRNTLALHVKGRHFRSFRVGAMHMWGVAHAAVAAQSFLDLSSSDGGASVRQLPYGIDPYKVHPAAAPSSNSSDADGQGDG